MQDMNKIRSATSSPTLLQQKQLASLRPRSRGGSLCSTPKTPSSTDTPIEIGIDVMSYHTPNGNASPLTPNGYGLPSPLSPNGYSPKTPSALNRSHSPIGLSSGSRKTNRRDAVFDESSDVSSLSAKGTHNLSKSIDLSSRRKNDLKRGLAPIRRKLSEPPKLDGRSYEDEKELTDEEVLKSFTPEENQDPLLSDFDKNIFLLQHRLRRFSTAQDTFKDKVIESTTIIEEAKTQKTLEPIIEKKSNSRLEARRLTIM
jgi:hypothetical protein